MNDHRYRIHINVNVTDGQNLIAETLRLMSSGLVVVGDNLKQMEESFDRYVRCAAHVTQGDARQGYFGSVVLIDRQAKETLRTYIL